MIWQRHLDLCKTYWEQTKCIYLWKKNGLIYAFMHVIFFLLTPYLPKKRVLIFSYIFYSVYLLIQFNFGRLKSELCPFNRGTDVVDQGVPMIITTRGDNHGRPSDWSLSVGFAAAAVGGGEQTLNSTLKPNHMCVFMKRDLTMVFFSRGAGKKWKRGHSLLGWEGPGHGAFILCNQWMILSGIGSDWQGEAESLWKHVTLSQKTWSVSLRTAAAR